MSSDSVEELTVRLGDLEISVRRRGDHPGELSAESSLTGLRASAVSAESGAEASAIASLSQWSVAGSIEPWSPAWREALLAATTPAAILEVDLQPVEHLDLERRITGTSGGWTARARVGRALRAGIAARGKLAGAAVVVPFPQLDLSNCIYVVLCGAPGKEPCFCHTAKVYFTVVRASGSDGIHPSSVSHAFPSRAEAEAYAIGAQERWPQERRA